MGIFSRFHRVPPFLVGTLCGGGLYIYYYQNLERYRIIPHSIWNIAYPQKSDNKSSIETEQIVGSSQSELYDLALNKRKNREYYRDSFIIGWNDSVRSVHAFLIRNIFGEELQ